MGSSGIKMPKVGVIADDLTGANDTGIQFRKHGLAAVCLLSSASDLEKLPEADVIIVDTESRDKSQEEARRLAGEAAATLRKMGVSLFYKKIDSTMRGNIGVEIDAVMDTLGINATILTPSYPANGRVVIGGYLFVNGILPEETEHPAKTPNVRSSLQALLSTTVKRRVNHIGLETVSQGSRKIGYEIAQKVCTEGNVFTIDATSRDDLAKIAQAASETGMKLVCGSAGLAEEIPYAYGLARKGDPVLAVVGSVNPTSMRQVNEVRRMSNIATVNLEISKLLLAEPLRRIELERATNELAGYLDKKIDSILISAESMADVEVSLKAGSSKGLNENEVRASAARFLSRIVGRVIDQSPVSGLFITGGETAIHILNELQATAVKMIEEISPGIPAIRLLDGRFAGLKVVTKAGGFGDDYAIIDAIRYLRNRGDSI